MKKIVLATLALSACAPVPVSVEVPTAQVCNTPNCTTPGTTVVVE